MSLVIRTATAADAALLAKLGYETFVETFVETLRVGYPPDDLAAFVATTYTPEAFHAHLAAEGMGAWVAEQDGRAIAYATAGPNKLPHPEAAPGDGELKRIYVRRESQGTGLGRTLLATTLAWLERDGPRTLWIGVWSGNEKAQRLYAHHGFTRVGEYLFPVGKTLDRELILRRLA